MQNLPRLTWILLLAGGFLAVQRPSDLLVRTALADTGSPGASTGTATAPGTEAKTAPAEPAAPVESAEAIALLHEARQRLFGYSSVRANIRESVQLGELRFEATGTYISGPFNPLPQLRLEYQVRVGNTIGTLLEVCDGQILRTQRSMRGVHQPPSVTPERGKSTDPTAPTTTVTRRDVRKILEALNKYGPTPEAILQAELGIGGLPALLTSMERCMVFDSLREEPLAGRPCYVLQAVWKPDYLEQISEQFRYFGRNVQAYLPAFTRVHLDAETLFPLRVTYWPTPAESGPARPPLLTLEFTDVRLNEGVNPLMFEFPATGADETDGTEQFIDAIRAAAHEAQNRSGSLIPSLPEVPNR